MFYSNSTLVKENSILLVYPLLEGLPFCSCTIWLPSGSHHTEPSMFFLFFPPLNTSKAMYLCMYESVFLDGRQKLFSAADPGCCISALALYRALMSFWILLTTCSYIGQMIHPVRSSNDTIKLIFHSSL